MNYVAYIPAAIVAVCVIANIVRLYTGWKPTNGDIMMVLCWTLLWVLALFINFKKE